MDIYFPSKWSNQKRYKWASDRILASGDPLASLMLLTADCMIGEIADDLGQRIADVEQRLDSASLRL